MAQASHSLANFIIRHPFTSLKWNTFSNIMVCLSVPNLAALQDLSVSLKKDSIPFNMFYEPDFSEHTSITTTDAAAPFLKGLPLAFKNNKRDVLLVQQ